MTFPVPPNPPIKGLAYTDADTDASPLGSHRDGSLFTPASDVWSYGVVLWEIAALGALPYRGMTNHEVCVYVLEGRRLQPPQQCPGCFGPLMTECWQARLLHCFGWICVPIS